MKTYSAKPGEVIRRWYIVDAEGQILGRLASRVATVLRGKHKPQFTPHLDVGDFVIVVNAEKIKLTGDKLAQKQYRKHSGYPGGLRELWYGKLLETHPERAIEKAVWGMLPKTSLGRRQLRKLKVYAGPDHPHEAQKPEPFPITTRGADTVEEATPAAPAEAKAEAKPDEAKPDEAKPDEAKAEAAPEGEGKEE